MDKSLSSEKKYLASVVNKIDRMELQFEGMSENIREQITEMRRRIWDDQKHGEFNSEDLFELTQISMTESAEVNRFYDFRKRLKLLEKMRYSPYFARLDFKEEGSENEESIYIGYLSLIDGAEVLVCDWRADISSMFYDSPLGKTFYRTQNEVVNVDLTLRRQFKIKNSKLEFMFDSDIVINDSVLQEELGKTSDMKLKTIITTIQKEQNTIIRDLSGDLLLVQGVAGSGKTSIALHRIAYLLYKHRNSLTADNVIIFSPNGVFSSYISDVLPELGESRVLQTDFYDYFDSLLFPETEEEQDSRVDGENDDSDEDSTGASEKYIVERIPTEEDLFFRNLTEQNEAVRRSAERFASVKLKGSDSFSEFLEKYLDERIEKTSFHDIVFIGDTVMTSEELRNAFYNDFRGYSSEVRKNKILGKLLDHVENDDGFKASKLKDFSSKFKKQAAEAAQQFSEEEINDEATRFWNTNIARLTEDINGMFAVDAMEIYLEALKEYSAEEYEKTVKVRKTGHLYFEDMLCVIYVGLLSGKIPQQYRISQVVVDEAQDYPPIIYKILAKLCRGSKFTILGDINQALTPHISSVDEISRYIPAKNVKSFNLKKSYRSTVEINSFINRFRKEPVDAEYLDRHGEEPKIVLTEDPVTSIAQEIASLKKSGYRSNAVICASDESAKELYEELKEKGIETRYIKSDSAIAPGNTHILPVYLAKGLEFDGVIIPDLKEFSGSTEENRLLYVACSRALHRLTVFKTE